MSGAFSDLIEAPPSAPGWYGKMPALGDFASRRLPEPFIQAWDRWLSAGIDASRAMLAQSWLDCFVRAPIWRFGLTPGTIDSQAWFGVMMPSVDRVGRYFPLTIAAPVAVPESIEAATSLQGWLRRLHDVALASLNEGHSVAQLEATLESLLPPSSLDWIPEVAPTDRDGWPIREDDLAGALARASLPRLWQQFAGYSLWWCAGSQVVRPYRGLPGPDQFHTLLAAPAG